MGKGADVTVTIDPRRLKGAVAKAVRPRFREAGNLVAAQVKADLLTMNTYGPGGGGAGKAGTLAKAIVVRKRGLGVRVGAKSGTEPAAALMRLQAGYAGRDRLGRIYTQPGRPIFGPVVGRLRSAILRKIQG